MNVYTPLLGSSRTTKCQPPLLSNSSSSNTFRISENGTAKPLAARAKSQNGKVPLDVRPRGQRSAVRPFFCCGSELSLVSLVDGLELKDSPARKVASIECNGSSEEDESSSSGASSRKTSGTTAMNNLAPIGEGRTQIVRRKKKDKHNAKKKFWSLRIRGRWNPRWRASQPQRVASHRCDISYHATGCQGTYQPTGSPGSGRRSPRIRTNSCQFIDLTFVQDFDKLYPTEDIDTIRKRERAEEMATGVEVGAGGHIHNHLHHRVNWLWDRDEMLLWRNRMPTANPDSAVSSPEVSSLEDYSLMMNNVVRQWSGPVNKPLEDRSSSMVRIHTQIDFIHCLVPQLNNILACPFYWGVMDRYEAERLLDNKPEGTFLLRDSAQEDFLFSVSFRRYNRSLHARVEQWNHRFSFDAHDPAVFSAPSVCELMEHYKDPCCCMFFEPMLTRPLVRNFPFSLQHICRAVICDRLVYDQIRLLPLPNSLKQFLQVYHYKQKVRVRVFDDSESPCLGANVVH